MFAGDVVYRDYVSSFVSTQTGLFVSREIPHVIPFARKFKKTKPIFIPHCE